MTTGNWNVGSITEHVGAIVGWTNIPASISGTTFTNMVEQEINFVELYATDTIDSTSISEKYQPSIIDLSYSKLLLSLDAQEGGIDSVHLGDLSYSQGAGGHAELAKQLRIDAINRLKELQRTLRFKRVIGGY